MLEYFVHLDPEDPPGDLVLAIAEVPEGLSREQMAITTLPAFWRDTPAPPDLAQVGDDFVMRAKNCVLIVPSALAVSEHNWLINPQHADFHQIVQHPPEPLHYDPRLFGPGRRRRKP